MSDQKQSMAAQKVPDKQKAILEAAIAMFAERGFWNTSTSLIAKTAGVADGTLFNYFETKDDLINEVYLYIKRKVANLQLDGLSAHLMIHDAMRHIWNRYIDWGVQYPEEFKVLYQIKDSYQLSEAVKAEQNTLFAEIAGRTARSIAEGELRNYPADFLAAFLDSHAIMTIQFIAANHDTTVDYRALSFDILWNGITH